jgi:RNA binding exosome subunit
MQEKGEKPDNGDFYFKFQRSDCLESQRITHADSIESKIKLKIFNVTLQAV